MSNPKLLSAVKSLLVAVGVTGTLVATGYVIESSYQNLLGVEIQYLSSVAYLLSAGRFLVDLLGVTLRCLGDVWTEHRVLVIVTVLVVAGVLFLPLVWARADRASRVVNKGTRRLFLLPFISPGSIVLIFTLLLLWKLARYDLPWVWVEKALVGTADLERRFGPSKSMQQRVAPLWKLLLCSHRPTPGEKDQKLKQLDSACGKDQTVFVRETDHMFFRELFWTSVVVALGLLVLASLDQKGPETQAAADDDRRGGGVSLGSVLMAIFLILNVLSVPYVYGKTIRLASPVRRASISYSTGQNPQLKQGYIIAQSDKEMVFIDASGRRDVFYLPTSEVTLVQVSNVEDVFAYYIRITNAEAPAPLPQPRLGP